MSGITGKEIQHLYRLSPNGHAVYDRTEIIEVHNVDYKTSIVHLIILPESKPDADYVKDYAKVKGSFWEEPQITLESEVREDVLFPRLPTRTEVLDALIDAGTEKEEDEIVDKLPETFWDVLPGIYAALQ